MTERSGATRVVFLDRDGVINEDRKDHVRSLDDWRPIEGSLEAIARLSRAGLSVVVVTNQSGIDRGWIDEPTLTTIHDHLRRSVERLGGRITAILHCPHDPEAGCDCRKPATGLIDRARSELGVDPVGAPFIGDRETDLIAARTAGCRPILVRSDSEAHPAVDLSAWPEVRCYSSLAETVDALLAGEDEPGFEAGPG